jgi:Family of unknown function (DUF6130)
MQIVPVFGERALNVSARGGHLHITVDDLPWHWADTSNNNTIDIVGLPPGPAQGADRIGRRYAPRLHRAPRADGR